MRPAPAPSGCQGVGPSLPTSAPVLKVDGLEVEFRTSEGRLAVVRGVSYEVSERETLAIVGESGSGKTVSAHAILGILDSPPAFVTGGSVRFRDLDLLALRERERRELRGDRIALVVQDSLSGLNPAFTVGQQIADMFRKHRGVSKKQAWGQAVEALERVRLPDPDRLAHSYPHELSGGMRQRGMIAMAVALRPDVLIADEPTTALDVTIQAQILKLLAGLQQETGMAIILITHDLAVVAEMADRVAVMYAGKIVESSPVPALYRRAAHPYTLGLMKSVPRADRRDSHLVPIKGSPPRLTTIPSGCPFHPRCEHAKDKCSYEEPKLRGVALGRSSACHFAEEVLAEGE